MKRISLFVLFSLSIVAFIALQTTNRVTGDNHLNHQTQALKPSIDGARTPEAIPNHAAQAMVYRILSSDEPDRFGDRKKAYLRAYGFNDDAQAALMLAAREYKQLVTPL